MSDKDGHATVTASQRSLHHCKKPGYI